MPQFVYDGTPNSVQYQIMDGVQVSPTGVGGFFPCPDEYQPISLEVVENDADIYIEPALNATYFEMVQLKEGMWWPITDENNQLLYWGIVDDVQFQRDSGTVSYTFITLMTYLAKHIPAGIMARTSDLIPGVEKATPNQVLQVLINHWAQEIPGLHLVSPVPELHIKTIEGNIIPWVMFITVQQDKEQISVLEWLQNFFGVFPDYTWRFVGTGLHITPPPSEQTESISLDDALVIEVKEAGGVNIINSQRVTQRPWYEYGEVIVEADGKVPGYDKLPQVCDPTYIRQGDTEKWPPPENRKRIEPYDIIPWNYKPEHFPNVPPAVLLWHAFVFKTARYEGGDVKHKDVSESLQWRTHIVALGPNRYFDAVTVFPPTEDAPERNWVYRIMYLPKGLKITPINPVGNITYEDTDNGIPGWMMWIPGVNLLGVGLDALGVFPDAQVTYGAEFHISVFGRAFERDTATYSAHYGVFRPPTMPPDATVPETVRESDAITDASAALFGRRPGADINLDTWTLVPPETDEADLSVMPVEQKQITLSQVLMDIAQQTVKENINPSRTRALRLARPYPVVASDIGKLVTYGDATGELSYYGLNEAHTMDASLHELEIRIKLKQGAEYGGAVLTPADPDDDPTDSYVPPFMPPDGGLTPRPPPQPPTLEPMVLSGQGSIEIEDRFDLLSIEGPNGARLRLYRDEDTATADYARPFGTKPEKELMSKIIGEGRIEADNWHDFHAIVGHVPEGTVYYTVEGGSVTLHRFAPMGRKL